MINFNDKWIISLSASVLILSLISSILATWLILRPVVIKEVTITPDGHKLNKKENVVFDLGNGRKIEAPSDGILIFDGELNTDDRGSDIKQIDVADAKGITISTSGDNGKLALEMDFGLPSTSIDGGANSAAGYANLGVKMLFTKGPTPLYWIGGIAIILGAILIFGLKATKIGIGFIAGGASLIMMGMFFTQYPWVLWIFFIALIVGIGFLFWDYWKKRDSEITLESVVAAGEQLPNKFKKLFTKYVRSEAEVRGVGKTARNIISKAKDKNAVPRARYVDITNEEKEIYEELSRRIGTANNQQVIMVPDNDPTLSN